MGSCLYGGTSARDWGFLKVADSARHRWQVSGCGEGPRVPCHRGDVPEQRVLTVGKSHRQPNGVGGIGVAVEDAAGPLQREGGGSDLAQQCHGGHAGHVGQPGWGSGQ